MPFAISGNGTLAYVPGGLWISPRAIVEVDREGKERPLKAPVAVYQTFDVSPDGKQIAAMVFNGQGGQGDIWDYNVPLDRMTRLTFDGQHYAPMFTPDGSKLAFGFNKGGAINPQ
jgi:tricorn protease-like protein